MLSLPINELFFGKKLTNNISSNSTQHHPIFHLPEATPNISQSLLSKNFGHIWGPRNMTEYFWIINYLKNIKKIISYKSKKINILIATYNFALCPFKVLIKSKFELYLTFFHPTEQKLTQYIPNSLMKFEINIKTSVKRIASFLGEHQVPYFSEEKLVYKNIYLFFQ